MHKVQTIVTHQEPNMPTAPTRPSVDAPDFAILHDQALRRAQELRREAVDDFWRGTDAAWSAGLATARRSAQRLAYRLARHAQLRRGPSQAK